MRAFQVEKIPKPSLSFVPPGGPLDLEIGAGQGLHAIRYAAANPDRNLIAVEKTNERFARLTGRKEKHPGLNNLHVLHADAVAFVSHYLPDESLERVFLLYPNPYLKTKHRNLRWHNRPFMGHLHRKMKPGAELMLATNIQDYAREAAQQMVTQWDFILLEQTAFSGSPRTHFEKKYLERGEICWNLRFQKRR